MIGLEGIQRSTNWQQWQTARTQATHRMITSSSPLRTMPSMIVVGSLMMPTTRLNEFM